MVAIIFSPTVQLSIIILVPKKCAIIFGFIKFLSFQYSIAHYMFYLFFVIYYVLYIFFSWFLYLELLLFQRLKHLINYIQIIKFVKIIISTFWEVDYLDHSDYITFYQNNPSLESGYRLVDEPVETGDGYIAHLTKIHRNATQNSPDSGMDPSYQNTKKFNFNYPGFRYKL